MMDIALILDIAKSAAGMLFFIWVPIHLMTH